MPGDCPRQRGVSDLNRAGDERMSRIDIGLAGGRLWFPQRQEGLWRLAPGHGLVPAQVTQLDRAVETVAAAFDDCFRPDESSRLGSRQRIGDGVANFAAIGGHGRDAVRRAAVLSRSIAQQREVAKDDCGLVKLGNLQPLGFAPGAVAGVFKRPETGARRLRRWFRRRLQRTAGS